MTEWSTVPGQRTDTAPGSKLADRTRDRLVRRLFLPVWLVLGGLTVLFALGLTVPVELGYALVLVSVLVVGLPHGAVDHLVVRRLGGSPRSEPHPHSPWRRLRGQLIDRSTLLVGLLYAVLGGVYLLGWFRAPAAAFAGFIALTWFHWGLGDLYAVLTLGGADHLKTRTQRALNAAVRGAIPMFVPLVAFPEEYAAVATLVVSAIDPAGVAAPVTFDPQIRLAVAGGLAVLLIGSIALGYWRASSLDGWALDAGELLLLVAFFTFVPPVLAIGVYFPLWHSLRHVQRVQLLDPLAAEDLRMGDLRPALTRFARDAAPFTAGALVLLGGLFVLVPNVATTLQGAVAVYLVLLAVLTLPHTVITTWADFREGVWRPAE